MKLSENTIFITGGGSGIGRGLAEALHQRKNQVIIAGRRKDRLMEVAAANPGMAWIELNIEDPASISAVATKLTAEYPKLNVLINNAGIMNVDDVSSAIDEKLLVSTLTTNLMGPIRMTGALIEHLKLLKGAFIERDATVVDRYFSPDYVQHNPVIPNGPRAIANLIPTLKTLSYEIGMVVAEGDLVMVHGRYVGWGPKPLVAVDIFKVKNGKVVEHWDVMQEEVPASATASGNPMFRPA
jgi:NAD(P)-dependent dehydrogenase (short-subunit alcohol dehydrogenase family)